MAASHDKNHAASSPSQQAATPQNVTQNDSQTATAKVSRDGENDKKKADADPTKTGSVSGQQSADKVVDAQKTANDNAVAAQELSQHIAQSQPAPGNGDEKGSRAAAYRGAQLEKKDSKPEDVVPTDIPLAPNVRLSGDLLLLAEKVFVASLKGNEEAEELVKKSAFAAKAASVFRGHHTGI